MTLAVSNGSVFVGKNAYKSNGTSWVMATAVYKSNGTSWVLMWSSVLTATPNNINESRVRPATITVTVTTSKAATAAWVSGGAGISVTGSGTSFNVSSTASAGLTDINRSGTLRFTATDGTGQTYDVPVAMTFIGSA